MGCVRKMMQTLWQGLLDYARIAWERALKDDIVENASIYNDVLAKLNMRLGGERGEQQPPLP